MAKLNYREFWQEDKENKYYRKLRYCISCMSSIGKLIFYIQPITILQKALLKIQNLQKGFICYTIFSQNTRKVAKEIVKNHLLLVINCINPRSKGDGQQG